jgi:long-chain acyl-CoA synthetase
LTSGSTDLPKAAVASEVQMINDGRHIVEAMGITPTDVNLAWIPFSHSFALGNLIMPLIWQGTSLALRRRFTPSQLVSDLMASAATVFPGVPFMFDYIRRNESIPGLPRTLRLLISAGAPIDIHTVEWFHRHLDRKIHSFYGSSETGGITYDDSEDVTDPLHVGHAMPETTVTIKSPDRERADGRIFVQGTAVSSGYAGTGSVDAAAAFQEGGFLTGDLGHFDRECRLVLTGRASPLVNVAGRKVDPVEIEHALLQLQGVADARVLGMTCDTRGEQVVAFVVRDDVSLTALGLRQLCAAKLSAHKIPRRFIFVEDFPVDARGKIDRQRLQTLASPQN